MIDIEKAKDALKIAREALAERRGYCPQWEYKYGAEWDNEDGYINDTIAALEEKPSEACSTFRCYIASSDCSGCCLRKDCFPNEGQVQAFAESYHARECAKCRELGGRA